MSHGRRETTAESAIRSGDRVTADASHGYAIEVMPSPRFEIPVALQSFQYEAPSLVLTFDGFTVVSLAGLIAKSVDEFKG
jgi:hypothetical protein